MLLLWVHLQKQISFCQKIFVTLIVRLKELSRGLINQKSALKTLRNVSMLWAGKLCSIKLTYSILNVTRVTQLLNAWRWIPPPPITTRRRALPRARLWPSWGTLDGRWMIKICGKLLTELVVPPTLSEMLKICTLTIFNSTRRKGSTAPAELKLLKLREPVNQAITWPQKKKQTSSLTLSIINIKTPIKITPSLT